jgi:hypothetical protein
MQASRKLVDFDIDLSYNSDYKENYEELVWRYKTGYEASPFKGRTFADVFLCAMAMGYLNDKHIAFPGKKSAGIPGSALKERGQILVMSVAIAHEETLDVLFDPAKVYSIAESYANGGFAYLLNLVVAKDNIGAPVVRMENMLREEIKKALARRPAEKPEPEVEMTPFEMIEDLEDTLRKLIIQKLGEISDSWMQTRLPPGILNEWKKREKSDADKVPKPPKMPLINRSHLGELKDIILRKDNWKEKFKPIFNDEKLLESQIKLLVPIRNQIMHANRDFLTNKQVKTLEAGYEILMSMIRPDRTTS